MQIKPSGVVDVCIEGILLSARFHSNFPCWIGEEEVQSQPISQQRTKKVTCRWRAGYKKSIVCQCVTDNTPPETSV